MITLPNGKQIKTAAAKTKYLIPPTRKGVQKALSETAVMKEEKAKLKAGIPGGAPKTIKSKAPPVVKDKIR